MTALYPAQSRCPDPDLYKSHVKRAIDLTASIALSPISLLGIAVIAPFIKLTDGGPVLYKSPRLGMNGDTFTMYKLRTMSEGAPDFRNPDGSTVSTRDDVRVTRIGSFLRRTSLDEMPQIFNVVKGEMSLVGPRPDLPEQISHYDSLTTLKLCVRPGITGYNQANFRNSIPWPERLKNDAYYASHMSLLLDTKIVLKTVASLLSPAGMARVHQTPIPRTDV